MGMNFPDVPTNGQVFGIYTWDGEKWIVTPVAPGGGITQADADIRYVNIPGDTMTGALTLNADPTVPLHAATKQYVDNNSLTQAAADTRYVNVAGDTMTGPLTVQSGIASQQTASTGTYYFGSSGTPQLNYDGINFNLLGGPIYCPALLSAGAIYAGSGGSTGYYQFGNTGTKYLNYDGTNFNLVGGTLNTSHIVSSAHVWSALTPTTGAFQFGSSGNKYIQYDGTNFNLAGGPLQVSGTIRAGGEVWTGYGLSTGIVRFTGVTGDKYLNYDGTVFNLLGGTLNVANSINSSTSATTGAITFGYSGKTINYDGAQFNVVGSPLYVTGVSTGGAVWAGGYRCRNGLNGPLQGNYFNINHTGAQEMWIDNTFMGNIAYTSDYRIKKDVIDLPGMWDTVKALRPIKYTQAQFSPPSHVKFVAEETLRARKDAEENPEAKPREVNTAPLYSADDIERWGFIAHELQATLTSSAATGVKDADDTIQSPNPWTVISALTKALQEAMTRIEALEAAP